MQSTDPEDFFVLNGRNVGLQWNGGIALFGYLISL